MILQSGWRARVARLQLRKLKAVVVIQKHMRGIAVRTAVKEEASAAIRIQVSVFVQGLGAADDL